MDEIEIKTLSGVIDRIEGDKAVIKTDDGQEIVWPKNKLSQDLKEGSQVNLIALGDEQMQEHREQIAKGILKEIFNSDD